MTDLRMLALDAHAKERETVKDGQQKERDRQIQAMRDKWADRWKHRIQPMPSQPAEMRWGSACTETLDSVVEVKGVRFEIDDIPFIYLDREGIKVIATCPDCGAERAYSFHSAASLGKVLTDGRLSYGHTCLTPVARVLAYQIGTAARLAKVSVNIVIDEAMRHGDQIRKGM